jgi:hypothetical protein
MMTIHASQPVVPALMTQTAVQAISARARAYAKKRGKISAKLRVCHAAAPTSAVLALYAARWMDPKTRNAIYRRLSAAMELSARMNSAMMATPLMEMAAVPHACLNFAVMESFKPDWARSVMMAIL